MDNIGSFQVLLSGDWCDFPPKVNKRLRDAYMAGEIEVEFGMVLDGAPRKYVMDFAKMEQRTMSGCIRPVRIPYDVIKEIMAIEAAKNAALAGGDTDKEEVYAGKGDQAIAKARKALLAQMGKTTPQIIKTFKIEQIDALIALRAETKAVVMQCMKAPLSEEEVRPLRDRLRKVHNAVQDLRGAIRVYARTRPFNQREKDMGAKTVLHFADDKMTLKCESLEGDVHKFQFDTTFNPGTQVEVYEELSDLIQSAYDGYNITVFAYGQTGSGKTFTMYGPKSDKGAVCRAIDDVFKAGEEAKEKNEVELSVGMVELYCAAFSDLFNKMPQPPPLTIRKDQAGSTYLENQVEKVCKNADEMWGMVEHAFDNRRTAATAMNADSSRSHLIVTVKVKMTNKTTGQKSQGKLVMVDLAGSERVKDSMVEGDQLKEAIEINKSLTVLGDVFEQLVSGSKSVGYRNHQLTQILADSLGGTAKTLMFANLSPASVNFNETVMTCKWASRAKNVVNDGGASKAAAGKEAAKSKPKAKARTK